MAVLLIGTEFVTDRTLENLLVLFFTESESILSQLCCLKLMSLCGSDSSFVCCSVLVTCSLIGLVQNFSIFLVFLVKMGVNQQIYLCVYSP